MAQSIVTRAFEAWNVKKVLDGQPAVPDQIVFALIPNQDENQAVNRDEGMPAAAAIKHRAAITQSGVLNTNAVVYSVVLDTAVGDWDYNWIGLVDSKTNTVLMIVHVRTQQKIKTQNGRQGNSLTRNLAMQFDGAAAATQINVSAATWQIDFSARLFGMDEAHRLAMLDYYGAAAFLNDGFRVSLANGVATVMAGIGYVGGLRAQLDAPAMLNVSANTSVWLDVSRQGTVTGAWENRITFTAATALADYIDQAGYAHYVTKLAAIVSGQLTDNRPLSPIADLDSRFILKDQNGADIPNKPLFRENAGITALLNEKANSSTVLLLKGPIGASDLDTLAGQNYQGRWTQGATAQEFSTAGGAGNTQTLPVIPAIRPGVIVNSRRITKVAIDNDDMLLTWIPLNASGKPAQKPPAQRQIEQYYPELGAGLHLPRLARVMSANDSAALGDQSDPFRPRYAVNLQLLDENGNPAADTPEYNAVPLPVPMAGAEGGMFQYPPAGAVVEIGFAEGRPDKPVIRQTMQDGMALPDIKPGEQLQQQRAGVSQRVTTDGSWQRETDQTIQERSSQRHVTSDAETRTTTTRTITVNGTDTITVLGTHKLLAGAVVALADGDYAIGTSANMLIRSSKDRNDYVGQNYNSEVAGALTERIAGIRRSVAAQQELIAPSIRLGSDQLNVLTLLTDTLDVLHTLAQQTASHTHNNTGAPLNAGAINNTGQRATALREKYGPFIA
ncbi:phage tail-collar fiber domain-containing protein [Pectobacterium versatile]|uniref:phage tail-collar fiber domain-containing protein n=1 Tax=Pectobacterium versatile TaxID=2488639 RepID=UPI000D1B8FFB|nr:phage tail protein [Pectobacterium versatile]AVT58002.1 tail fiber protein [Pectobacterium versatile]